AFRRPHHRSDQRTPALPRMHHDAAPDKVAFRKTTQAGEDNNFVYLIRRPKTRWDDDIPDLGGSTYNSVGTQHGPEPVPDWVITSDEARDEDLGDLKSGKEADVAIVERTHLDQRNLLAAKRYRDTNHRTFRNDAAYRMGKEPRDGRTARAIKK